MKKYLTPEGYILSTSEEGIYFIGWLTIDEEEGEQLLQVSKPLPDDTKVPPGGKYQAVTEEQVFGNDCSNGQCDI